MKKIMIVGSPCSGKSTLATSVSSKFHLPLYHLDQTFWLDDKTHLSDDAFETKLKGILEADAWVLDGNYYNTMALRMNKTDCVIWLDFPRNICLYRVIKRFFSHHRTCNPFGNPDKLDIAFLRFVWQFKKNNHSNMQLLMDKSSSKIQIIKLTNSKEVTLFLNTL